MRRLLDRLEQFAVDVILERRAGRRASILRLILRALSFFYLGIVSLRLRLYASNIMRRHQIGCPVVSIGNLTVGGTGKTPVVEKLARDLSDRGRKVAILSRGYKSTRRKYPIQESSPVRVVSDGGALLLDSKTAGDEPFMLAKNLRGVAVVVDKDRVECGRHAISRFGTDLLLLDDGLQYLRLHRRFDLVLIDREAPFGNEHLLPRGTLREPPENLSRASHILITKCDGSNLQDLHTRIRAYNRTAPIIECRHRPVALQDLSTGENLELSSLQGLRAASLSAIASPESFEQGLRRLGVSLELMESYADHHRYSKREIDRFIRRCVRRGVSCILTTEKDAVRMPRLLNQEIPIRYLRIEIELLKGQEHWDTMLEQLLNHPQPLIDEAFTRG
ncbi:MAG: tetraacyldisaccharide 4'-kinase [Verrucomicrobia bacterium]|nr:MAG: tetraacyldisaccharide 4'-kinase [Verrucomicrobiota bacterium]